MDRVARQIVGGLAALLAAAGAAHAAAPPWEIGLQSSGGYSGQGYGNFTADASGRYVFEQNKKTQCVRALSDKERAELDRAVKAAATESWQPDYRPAGNPSCCCDQFVTRLTLKPAGGADKVTEWCSASKGVPSAALGLGQRLSELRKECPVPQKVN